MKVLGIVCSPRLHGNTEVMVQESLAEAQKAGAEVELVTLAGKNIDFCDGCYSCQGNEGCHIKDDLQDINTRLLEADGIIFGTPVYFWSVSAQAKTLIDRSFAFLDGHNLRDKAAGVVVTARRAGTATAFTVFTNFFNAQRMIMVGGAIGYGEREKGGVKQDKEGMAVARALGRAMVRRIQSLNIKAK
ncbi:flavodoxin family protein [Chloroflexota bacterium]